VGMVTNRVYFDHFLTSHGPCIYRRDLMMNRVDSRFDHYETVVD